MISTLKGISLNNGRGIFQSQRIHFKSNRLMLNSRGTRRFYSKEENFKGFAPEEMEQKIVEECFDEKEPRSIPSKSLVGIHGWKKETLVLSSRRLGFPDVSHGIVQQGPLSLVSHFIQQSNLNFVRHLDSLGGIPHLKSLTAKEATHLVIKSRLSQLAPFIHNWSQAIGLMATPQNASHSVQYIASLIDEIAFISGDRSTNFDWYTKRATIFSIYTSTELFMLTDTSQDFNETWKFLERRIEDAASLSQFVSKVEDGVQFAWKGVTHFLPKMFYSDKEETNSSAPPFHSNSSSSTQSKSGKRYPNYIVTPTRNQTS
eukprot:TRINITY_DN3294_c0_g1_i3.p2 TRINITY_DN3294_c0_g1~~TRINITY_DN3294_c0_g1_i3.p2  ORF type:complete len:316 (+),score=127.59 TRINITY_DN3294_c0_g1_i3:287-1234(+)